MAEAVTEHQRTNTLHQQQLALALKIHEVESRTLEHYHRVSLHQADDLAARSLMQSKVLHEEQLDVAKRTSFRENLRDEWEQLSTKAETVLIVNTLMLGIAFTYVISNFYSNFG